MASHESFCKNLVDYFRQAALGLESLSETFTSSALSPLPFYEKLPSIAG
ncbi:hypothetical protein WH8501_14610 [Crocosphaera watsonii WH 8501]|nr:hypothetical protein [Crocosphaera watsonii]